MKVKCRSILVTGSQRINNATIRKSYDMNSVQSHEFDIPVYSTVSFYLYLPFAFLMAAAGIGGLILFPVGLGLMFYHRDDTKVLMTPQYLVPFLGLGLAMIAFVTWKLAAGKIKETLLDEAVCKVRGLELSSHFDVKEESQWDDFVKSLK